MNREVKISEVRDLIKFSGIQIEAVKRGSGLIHLYAKSYSDMTDFRGVCIVNSININVDSWVRPDGITYAYVGGRVQEEVNA
jgi:hypothetical protein